MVSRQRQYPSLILPMKRPKGSEVMLSYAKGVSEFPSVSIKAQFPLIWAAHRFLTHSLAGDSVGSFSHVSKPIASYLGGVISLPDSLKSAHFLFVFCAANVRSVCRLWVK